MSKRKESPATRLARELELPMYDEFTNDVWLDKKMYEWQVRHSPYVESLQKSLKDDDDHFLAIYDLQLLGRNPVTRQMMCSQYATYADAVKAWKAK